LEKLGKNDENPGKSGKIYKNQENVPKK